MSVVVIGLNHRTAPLDLLERTAVDDARLPKVLHDLCARTNLSEAVVLSTCNRIEVYAVAEKFHGGYEDVRNFFVDLSFLPAEEFADHLYVHYDDAAVTHLFTVAAGLDSAVLGESEILGQVASAWERARDEGTTGFSLNLLFRQALEVGKRARTETGIGRGITSVAQAAVAMATDRLGTLAGRRVLLLGAGEMGEVMATSLGAAGASDVVVANRTWSTAQELATRIGGRAARLADLPAELLTADVLLTSTGANTIMLEHADLASAMGHRDGRPLLIVDIAMPRDVDPAAGALEGVTLLDMDDLRRFVAVGVEGRQREATRALGIIEEELNRYRTTTTAREAAPLVTALREQAEGVRSAEVDRLASRLSGLDETQRAAVEALTKGIVAKLLHEPTVRLKDAAGTAKGDRLSDALRDLFDL
ncbi:MAG: glutamyl-tRNA reductase [Acidimicrobiaceae bacterium]